MTLCGKIKAIFQETNVDVQLFPMNRLKKNVYWPENTKTLCVCIYTHTHIQLSSLCNVYITASDDLNHLLVYVRNAV